MSIVGQIIGSASDLAKMPVEAFKSVASNYIALIFMGGFIFFIANTPADSIQTVGDHFMQGDIAGTLGAIVDMSIAFAENVKENFNPEALSEVVQDGICKIMNFTGEYECDR